MSDILKQYIKHNKLKEYNYLFGLKTDPTRRESNFSKIVSNIFTKTYSSPISITNKWMRVSYATYLHTLINLTINQRKDLALKMGILLQLIWAYFYNTTNLQYGKNTINIDDIDNYLKYALNKYIKI